jgi:hypothetical protein
VRLLELLFVAVFLMAFAAWLFSPDPEVVSRAGDALGAILTAAFLLWLWGFIFDTSDDG